MIRRLPLVLGPAFLAVLVATTAWANAPKPSPIPVPVATAVTNANGTVTVSVSGTWMWLFSPRSKGTREGFEASVKYPCSHSFGAGWAIAWNDPNDTGYTETFSYDNATATVDLGSQGINPSNAATEVTYNHGKPCGTFTETNVPATRDGSDSGPWSGSHIYASSALVPSAICVVIYNLGPEPQPGFLKLSNDNNSVEWSLRDGGNWDTTAGEANCVAVSTPDPPLPRAIITANDTTKVFGSANPIVGANYRGFANGDGPGTFSGALTCSSAATTSSAVGSYANTCSGLASAKYSLSYVPGTLSVTPTAPTTAGALPLTTTTTTVQMATQLSGRPPATGGFLAFTGSGPAQEALALAGLILVLLGLVLQLFGSKLRRGVARLPGL